MREQNIIIFSAGQSETRLKTLKKYLTDGQNYLWDKHNNRSLLKCEDWNSLFKEANNQTEIALLPILLKKIPTFDFAIILADAVDELKLYRKDETNTIPAMRDNVLFETGLCITALGVERVILLSDETIRIPDDFWGIGKIGFKNIKYNNDTFMKKLIEIPQYIYQTYDKISPIVIGASISSANGYFENFILRFWENISDEFQDITTEPRTTITHDCSKCVMKICIPTNGVHDNLNAKFDEYYKQNNYKRGYISSGTARGVEFRYRFDDNGTLIVCDIPTTVTASNRVVRDILSTPSDEKICQDSNLYARFLSKEVDTFEYMINTLKQNKSKIEEWAQVRAMIDEKTDWIKNMLKNVVVEKIDFDAVLTPNKSESQ